MKNILSKVNLDLFLPIFLLIFCSLILVFSLKGISGNPNESEINTAQWAENGPFELSPDRGRFALTYSIIENKSFFFSVPLARFATPDLGYKNGHYVSLFPPGVSFIIIPGYLIGKAFGAMQVGAYATIAIFAVLNAFLIFLVTKKLGVQPFARFLASIVFLFATPAFSYGVNLYQHHISTFLILLSLYILLRWKNLWGLIAIWFLCALSIPVDYPNLILMLPIGFTAITRIVYFKREEVRSLLKIRVWGLFTFIGLLLPLLFFLWFNNASYGNPLQFSGTVPSAESIDASGKPSIPQNITVSNAEKYLNPETQRKSALSFFRPRNIVNGLYLHLISPDRGVLYFAPVILIGILGAFLLFKVFPSAASLILGVFVFDLVLYSMWGDPWGGWAFGSRYLIPGYAMLAIFVGMALSWGRKNIAFLSLFFVLLAYSVGVNALGAITSNQNPPKVEVLALEKLSHKEEKYSFDRNFEKLSANFSKSFVWQTYLKDVISAQQYYQYLLIAILGPSLAILVLLNVSKKGGSYEL